MEPEQVFATYTVSLIFRRAGLYQLYVAQKNIQNSILRIIAQRPFELLGKNNVFYSSTWHNCFWRGLISFCFRKLPFWLNGSAYFADFSQHSKDCQSFSWEAKKFPPSMQQVSKPLIWYYAPRSTTRTLAIKKTNSTSRYFFKKKYHAHDFHFRNIVP